MRGTREVTVVTAILTLLVSGCGKRVQPVAAAPDPPAPVAVAPPPPPPPPSPPPPPPPSPTAALTEDELFARKTLAELNAERPLGDAFFDLDQAILREDARATLQGNARWMARWPTTRATIEGHCDDRGTSEYNLALGDRRADAVKSYLVSLGVSVERLLTVSKGEETPVCGESAESCWQQNRRGHFVITAK